MNAVLCLVIAFIPVVYAGNNDSWHRFDRQVTLDSLEAREHPSSIHSSQNQEGCVRLCAQDGLCAAVSILQGNCSIYRSSLTSSGKTVIGAKHFIKAGALPDPDPCPASKGYTSVLSPRLCYKYIPERNNWTIQNVLCQAEGGRLIVLNTQEKQEYMASFQTQVDVSYPFWIGMQKVNDVYTWLDNSTYVWKWYPLEPDNIDNIVCVQFYKGELMDIYCTYVRTAVCEIPL